MKKILYIFCSLVILVSLTACKDDDGVIKLTNSKVVKNTSFVDYNGRIELSDEKYNDYSVHVNDTDLDTSKKGTYEVSISLVKEGEKTITETEKIKVVSNYVDATSDLDNPVEVALNETVQLVLSPGERTYIKPVDYEGRTEQYFTFYAYSNHDSISLGFESPLESDFDIPKDVLDAPINNSIALLASDSIAEDSYSLMFAGNDVEDTLASESVITFLNNSEDTVEITYETNYNIALNDRVASLIGNRVEVISRYSNYIDPGIDYLDAYGNMYEYDTIGSYSTSSTGSYDIFYMSNDSQILAVRTIVVIDSNSSANLLNNEVFKNYISIHDLNVFNNFNPLVDYRFLENNIILTDTSNDLYLLTSNGIYLWDCSLSYTSGSIIGSTDEYIYTHNSNNLTKVSMDGEILITTSIGWGSYKTILTDDYIYLATSSRVMVYNLDLDKIATYSVTTPVDYQYVTVIDDKGYVYHDIDNTDDKLTINVLDFTGEQADEFTFSINDITSISFDISSITYDVDKGEYVILFTETSTGGDVTTYRITYDDLLNSFGETEEVNPEDLVTPSAIEEPIFELINGTLCFYDLEFTTFRVEGCNSITVDTAGVFDPSNGLEIHSGDGIDITSSVDITCKLIENVDGYYDLTSADNGIYKIMYEYTDGDQHLYLERTLTVNI